MLLDIQSFLRHNLLQHLIAHGFIIFGGLLSGISYFTPGWFLLPYIGRVNLADYTASNPIVVWIFLFPIILVVVNSVSSILVVFAYYRNQKSIGALIKLKWIIRIIWIAIIIASLISLLVTIIISIMAASFIGEERGYSFAEGFYLLIISSLSISFGSLLMVIFPIDDRAPSFQYYNTQEDNYELDSSTGKQKLYFPLAFVLLTIFLHTLIIIGCLIAIVGAIAYTYPIHQCNNDDFMKNIALPSGFKIQIYAHGVQNARSLTQNSKGVVFVSTKDIDKVYAIEPGNSPSERKVVTLASGLDSPNGIAYYNGSLYVAEESRIIRFDNMDKQNGFSENSPYTVIVNDLPKERQHGWRYIAFGPDGKLYISIGSPCNACMRYAYIMRMNKDGNEREIFAHGVRNSVGFDWHPQTKELWFTENGRDWLGDDKPADELNRAPSIGMHFGFPFCFSFGGSQHPDPSYGTNCTNFTAPEIELGPHVAALGMRFYTGDMFPNGFKNKRIFIAEHGSWNRRHKVRPSGYRVSTVYLKDPFSAEKYEEFASGWLSPDGAVCGRPVDVLVRDTGSLLVSDDFANQIYEIIYQNSTRN